MTVEELRQGLREHDKGVLTYGAHRADEREFCALEFSSIMRGEKLSDEPSHLPDIRPLNDGPWSSDEARTDAILPIMAAYWDWSMWSLERRQHVMTQVVLATVQRLISTLPGLPDAIREQCRSVRSLQQAEEAAKAAAKVEWAEEAMEAASAASWAASAARVAQVAVGTIWAVSGAIERTRASAASAAWAEVAAKAAVAATSTAAAADTTLSKACQIWVEAAHEGGLV